MKAFPLLLFFLCSYAWAAPTDVGPLFNLGNIAGAQINPATSDNQTNGAQKTQLVDASDVNFGTTANPIKTQQDVPLAANAPTTATVGIASASALAANASRNGLVITNLSNKTVSLGIGTAAVLNSGITLYPGGIWYMDQYSFTTGAINAIASGASSVISIQEFQ